MLCVLVAGAGPTKVTPNQQGLYSVDAATVEFVRHKPPLESRTIILWMLPPLALLAGAIGLFFAGRRRRLGQLEPVTLSNEEQGRLSTLVDKPRD